MPWKLIGFVVLLVFATIFIGFNLNHRCDVSIGFTTFHDVPIFLSLLIAFVLGVLVMVPYTFFKSLSGPKQKKNQAEPQVLSEKEDKKGKKNAETLSKY